MEKLKTNIVLEILGRPKEHVKESLNELIKRLESEKGVKIINKDIHEPIPKKDSNNLFTTFAELTLDLDSIYDYLGVLFAYLPSHSEIINPEKMTLTNIDLNDLGNKLTKRLHDYDAITKKTLYENQLLTQKLQEISPELFKKSDEQTPTEDKTKSKKKKAKSKKK